MIEQIDWLHIVIGLIGAILLFNAIFIMIYPRYYSFLNKTFYIELMSKQGIEEVEDFVNKNKDKQKLGIVFILVLLGIVAIHWAFGGHFLLLY